MNHERSTGIFEKLTDQTDDSLEKYETQLSIFIYQFLSLKP